MNTSALKPMLSYYGGDQRNASKLLALVDKIPHRVWVEVFCGGATLTFGKSRPVTSSQDGYVEVINDKNDWIYTFYKVARERPDELLHLIRHTPHSQACHRETHKILKSDCDDELKIAWAVFIQCNQSFGNNMFKGWAFSTERNMAATWVQRQNRLPLQLERLKSVNIDSNDAIYCIKRWDRQETLFYCDPPYVGTNCGHYKGYTQEDFDNLIKALDNCKGSFILNCYDNPSIPKHWNRMEIESVMSAAKNSKDLDCKRTQVVTWMDRSGVEQEPLLALLNN